MVLRRFIQRTEVGAVCLDLGPVCAAVGLLLVGAVGVLCKAHGALRRLLHAVGALHAHIVLLMLPNLTVYGGQGRRSGRVTHRMGQLGGRAFLSTSSKERRVVTVPVFGSTTRCFFFTVFLGIFVSAFSSF